jgi:type IV pilus assembly protein PilV
MDNHNRQKGFTLIEVLIAMTLLVIGILAVASMQIVSLGGNSLAIRVTEASTRAEARIESLMALPYDDAELDDDNGNGAAGLNDTNTAGSLADGGPDPQGGFTVYWNVADDTPLTGNKTIRVIVVRTDIGGFLKTLAVDYVKANDE